MNIGHNVAICNSGLFGSETVFVGTDKTRRNKI